jgi:hypothetical protein
MLYFHRLVLDVERLHLFSFFEIRLTVNRHWGSFCIASRMNNFGNIQFQLKALWKKFFQLNSMAFEQARANQKGMFHVKMLLQIATESCIYWLLFCMSWLLRGGKGCPTFQKAFTFCIHFRFTSHMRHAAYEFSHIN